MRKIGCKGTHYYIKKRIFATILLFFMKSEHEKLQFVGCKELLGNILNLCRRDGIDAEQQLGNATLVPIVQEVFGEVEGKLFAVVAGDGQLTFQLSFSSLQLTFRQRVLHESVEFTLHQSQATLHVVMVATEIDAPATRIAVADLCALNGIDQSIALAQRQVQASIHARTTKYVVQQEQRHAPRVVVAESLDTQHDVGLMVGRMRFDVRGLRDGARGARDDVRWLCSVLVHTPFEHFDHTAEINVPIDNEDGIVRAVVALGKPSGIE